MSSQEQLFFHGSSYFDALIKDLKSAQQSIDFETYIFESDSLGEEILQILIDAAKRNIQVRLLVDGAGTPQWGNSLVKKLEQAGGETRIFHPFPWRFWHWSRSHVRFSFLLKAIYLFLKSNSRNHRKTCIIDNKIAYVGSFNVDLRHLTKDRLGEGWRDTGVRLEEVDLTPLKEAFSGAWLHVHLHERIKQIFQQVRKNPIIRLNNSRHRRRILYKNLRRRMKKCSKRIWITNAYFVPDNFLLKTLTEAAKNGIDVRILLPRNSDVPFMPWASATFYEYLNKSGVRIFEYLPSMLHAKTLILDDWFCVGSTNLNHRSLLHDLEVDINIRDQHSKELLEKQFIADLENSKEVGTDNIATRKQHMRIIGRLLLYIKYWI